MSVFVIPPVMREYMTTRNRDAPMPETSAGSWDDLRREYEDSKATILGLRVETEEEGKERAKRLARRRPTALDVEELDVVGDDEVDARTFKVSVTLRPCPS
jgi:hypothetical protein